MSFRDFFFSKNRLNRAIFVLIIVYAILSIGCLLAGLRVITVLTDDVNYVMIGFAMISFVVTVFICAYHLSTKIQRRRRVTDKAET
jgi:hypothetical protein